MDTFPITVLVVDDHPSFRFAARSVLRHAKGFELIGEACSGEEAIAKVAELCPAVVLMDINMPGMGGIEATRRIITTNPDAVVFLFSTYQMTDLPRDAPTCGARAYVNKENLGVDVLERLWAGRNTVDFAPL